ncbi:MAG: site-2 protease family protein [Actinobacteria bacterium]|nr:site-2 protease family protein [Actinomycetota bacterium]
MDHLRFTGYLFVGLAAGMVLREYVRALVAARLKDPTPRLWGRLTLNPRAWFDPFGSGLLPGLILLLWAVGSTYLPPPVALAKPAPVDPGHFRRRERDTVIVSLAGPVTNVLLGAVGGLAVRAGASGQAGVSAVGFMLANFSLAFFHLLPIPGLDGARVVALFLPPGPREVYRNADQYLSLFVILVLFLFSGPILAIVYSFANVTCSLSSGVRCLPLPFL